MTPQPDSDRRRPARVTGIDHLALTVRDPDAVLRFYRDLWGFDVLRSADGAHWLAPQGSARAQLILVAGETNALHHLAFRAENDDDRVEIVGRLSGAGVRTERRQSALAPDREVEVTQDPDGNGVWLLSSPALETDRPAQPSTARPGARKLGHIVLWATGPEPMERFYSLLGLKVTDRTAVGMSFLRCNRDHHSLALARSRSRRGMQHAAYDGGAIDDVMRMKGVLTGAGVACVWGPGRHGPGNNIFTYYRDPAGNFVEFYAEMEQVAGDAAEVEVRMWEKHERGDVWGVAGPAPPEFRD